MKKYGLISAIALIVLTNVVVLAGVAYNRSGEPDAVVQLTERELHWRNSWRSRDSENSGIHLTLKWNMFNGGIRLEDTWFNQQKLTEVGFDTDYPLDANEANRYFSRQLPKQGYVVLEFDGDAYQNWLKQSKKQIEEKRRDLSEQKNAVENHGVGNNIWSMEQAMITHSRLFAINVGLDPQALRKQYADRSRYIITPATFRIAKEYTSREKGQPKASQKYYLRGWIDKILIPEIHVTSDYRSFFISDIKTHTTIYLPRDKPLSDLEPRYQVTLNYGQRYEPWIVNVQKLK